MQNDKLLNCPFCDKKLKRFKGGYEHKSSQCVLSSFILTDVEIPKWNTRKPMERIIERLKKEKIEGAGLMNIGHNVAISIAIELVRNGGKE